MCSVMLMTAYKYFYAYWLILGKVRLNRLFEDHAGQNTKVFHSAPINLGFRSIFCRLHIYLIKYTGQTPLHCTLCRTRFCVFLKHEYEHKLKPKHSLELAEKNSDDLKALKF